MNGENRCAHRQSRRRSGIDADAPWAELNGGKPINDRKLASILRRYDVRPVKVTRHNINKQGYRREHLADAWKRYLAAVRSSPGM